MNTNGTSNKFSITVSQLDEDFNDVNINMSAASASESMRSDFMSLSSKKSRSSSGHGRRNESRSPRSLNGSTESPGIHFLAVNKNSSSVGSNTYNTPEGRHEEVCNSARNLPKF